MAHTNRQSLKSGLTTAALALGSAMLPAPVAHADNATFASGSLIIPMQSNFQDSCGVTSAYGLVWQILRANQPGHYFANANHIVTVYVTHSDTNQLPTPGDPSN